MNWLNRFVVSRSSGRKEAQAAGVVRGLAGRAAGWRRDRRGSILVIVLGTLALLSVLTLVYVSLGRSDTRGSAVVLERDEVRRTATEVGDYIAYLVGVDAAATFVDGASDPASKSDTILVRETSDYPYTDPTVRSDPTLASPSTAFNPAGDHGDGSNATTSNLPSDPWLASDPTWLEPTPATPRWDKVRDWAHISNISPDGRYVNLFALRNNFGAKPGVRLAASEALRMSDGLWLFNANGSRPTGNNPPGPNANQNTNSTLPFGIAGPANLNVPAHWDMYQRHAHRPIRDIEYGPGDWRYLGYTWADADGDGLADSRWTELTDTSNPDNPKHSLGTDGPFRWFVAARIVDLSGRVNVNTATEFRKYATGAKNGAPTIEAPTGLVPSEIDLRRLLMLTDVYWDAGLGGAPGASDDTRGYSGLLQPLGTPGPYKTDNYAQATAVLMGDAGRGAYNALKAALLLGEAPARGDDVLNESNPSMQWLAPLDADARIDEYLKARAHADSAGYYTGNGGTSVYEVGGLPDASDLTELLTYNGLNNSATHSRLEQILGGRGSTSSPDNRYSPVRDNRGTLLERDDQRLQFGPAPLPAPPSPDLNGQASDEALRRIATDVRSKLTPDSGARPLVARPFPAATGQADVSTLTAADVRIDAVDALKNSPSKLFQGYAAALLPYAGIVPDFWLPTNAAKLNTLSYGHDPMLALRIAGHLAANLIDMADRDVSGASKIDQHEPEKFTLRLAGTPPPLTAPYDGIFLDLGDAKLDTTVTPPTVPLINIYGIEAQPFIVEAASLYVYRDTPSADGGDDESGPDPDPTQPHPEITIDTTLDADNEDLLLQALVFQIHNPFDVPIGLSKSDTSMYKDKTAVPAGTTDYYIEIDDKTYDLVDIDPAAPGVRRQVILQPGETRVFYALCDSLTKLEPRWPGYAAGNNSPMIDYLENQLTIRIAKGMVSTDIAPMLTHNPQAGVAKNVDLLGPAANVKDVKLKRLDSANPALFANHYVADRLSDPASVSTLKRVDGGSNQDIANTKGGQDGDNDNTGYTIAFWGRVKRNDYVPSGPTGPGQRGFIPPWCVEVRQSRSISKSAVNATAIDPNTTTATLSKTDFVAPGGGTSPSGRYDADAFINDFAPGTPAQPNDPGSIFIPTLRKEPKDKHTLTPNDDMPLNGSAVAFSSLVTEIPRIDHEFKSATLGVSTLRLADLLTPLGIGPEHNPAGASPDEEWLTLGEALAEALDYSRSAKATSVFGVWEGVGRTGANVFPKLDRGNLVLDDYAPFVDEAPQATPPAFDPLVDRRAGTGVPLALTIMDQFDVYGPTLGGLTRATPGLVNINTASLNVLRAIPMLSPTPVAGTAIEWFGSGQAGMPQPPAPGNPGSDLAATVVSYRDKTLSSTRSNQDVHFENSQPGDALSPPDWDGRDLTAQIAGLREQPGLASVGELMAMVDNSGASRIASQRDAFDFAVKEATKIDSSLPGVSASVYKDNANLSGPATLANEIIDEFAEKLTSFNGAAGVTTTRSDYFACWFVLHGYREGDCTNLSNAKGDPLVPTIAKRYLMVLDRSNVTQRGQRPKVLVFTELPM